MLGSTRLTINMEKNYDRKNMKILIYLLHENKRRIKINNQWVVQKKSSID